MLSSCSSDLGSLSSEGPESLMKVDLTASKVIAEPMKVKMTVSHQNRKHESEFEVYSSELNLETVAFNWENSTECRVVFQEWDDSPKTILIKAQLDGLLIKSLD